MNKKTITPHPQQPVERQPAGKLPTVLAELTEAALSTGNGAMPAGRCYGPWMETCSYDGDDA